MMTEENLWQTYMSDAVMLDQRPVLTGIIPVSGIFDLRPLQRSCENEGLHLTDEEVLSLKPFAAA